MTRPRISSTRLRITPVCILGLWSVIVMGLPDARPALAGEGASRTILSQPDSNVGLTVDLAGFKIASDQVKPDGRRYVMASHLRTGLNVSIMLERVSGRASSMGCVAHLRHLQKGSVISRGKDVALTNGHDVQTLEYTLHQFQGVRLDQKSMYACMAAQNVYANVHLSKLQYTAADASLFHAFLRSIHLHTDPSQKMAAQAAAPLSGLSHFQIESVRYQANNYVQAIAP